MKLFTVKQKIHKIYLFLEHALYIKGRNTQQNSQGIDPISSWNIFTIFIFRNLTSASHKFSMKGGGERHTARSANGKYKI
jgi:hypothetical protein